MHSTYTTISVFKKLHQDLQKETVTVYWEFPTLINFTRLFELNADCFIKRLLQNLTF